MIVNRVKNDVESQEVYTHKIDMKIVLVINRSQEVDIPYIGK